MLISLRKNGKDENDYLKYCSDNTGYNTEPDNNHASMKLLLNYLIQQNQQLTKIISQNNKAMLKIIATSVSISTTVSALITLLLKLILK